MTRFKTIKTTGITLIMALTLGAGALSTGTAVAAKQHRPVAKSASIEQCSSPRACKKYWF